MPVLKEYRCAAHGEFEGFEPACPAGCSPKFVVREFRTAPAIRHTGTSNTDKLTQQLANDFRLPDLSARDGESVMTNLRKKDWKKMQGVPPSVWADGVPHAKEGWTQREGEKAPTFDPKTVGMARGIALKDGTVPKVKPIIDPKMVYRAPLPEV